METIQAKLDLQPTKNYDDRNIIQECIEGVKSEIRAEFDAKLSERDSLIDSLRTTLDNVQSRLARLEKGTPILAEIDEIKAVVSGIPVMSDIADVPDSDTRPEIDVLLAGDSIVKWIDTGKVAKKGQSSELICMPAKKTEDVKKAVVEKLQTSRINTIVFHASSNNIPHDPPKKVARDLIQAAETFKTISPTTKVLISSVLPKIADNYIPGVREVNAYLVQTSMYLDFEVIHHHDFILNDKIDLSLFAKKEVEKNRPVHLCGKGIVQFARDIKNVLKVINYKKQRSIPLV